MTERSDWKEMTLSSGVRIRYGPFPLGLYWDIMARALDEHPEPEPPKKTIAVLNGTEEVDDLEDPEYKKDLNAARAAQHTLLGEAVLEFCVEIADDDWERKCDRIAAKYVKEPPPEDPDEKRIWYLSRYAFRTKQDWLVVAKVQAFSQIEDEEVRKRAEFFRGDVEGDAGDEADAPGPSEEQRVEVPGEGA